MLLNSVDLFELKSTKDITNLPMNSEIIGKTQFFLKSYGLADLIG